MRRLNIKTLAILMATYKELLNKCLSICNTLQPILKIIYNNKDKALFKTKADSSAVTLADILVQTFLRLALEPYIERFIGEETTHYNFITHSTKCPTPIEVTDNELKNLITTTYTTLIIPVLKLNHEKITGLTAFVDPIDGTSEFTKAKGHESTICIGFAKGGHPVAGLIYRVIPIQSNPEYALGSKPESLYLDTLLKDTSNKTNRILTSNGIISPFLTKLIDTGYTRVCSGGAGNKTLLLLENRGDLYIQDRGLSRWDTCAAQAILEAVDGTLSKLTAYIDKGIHESYSYVESAQNTDPNPDAQFSRMNTDTGTVNTYVCANNNQLKPYSNVCGLVAKIRNIPNIETTIRALISVVKPAFN